MWHMSVATLCKKKKEKETDKKSHSLVCMCVYVCVSTHLLGVEVGQISREGNLGPFRQPNHLCDFQLGVRIVGIKLGLDPPGCCGEKQ